MTTAFIGLGANLEDPAGQVGKAIQHLVTLPAVKLVRQSSLYRTAPLGPAGQADYCNAVVEVSVSTTARELLLEMQAIETALGRKRDAERWGPRSIDLDLLLFGDAVINEPDLCVPHPEMHKRNFVMLPLAEIAAQVEISNQGQVGHIAEQLGQEGIRLWGEAHG